MKDVYEFLDAIGTKEFFNVILELIDLMFSDYITNDPLNDEEDKVHSAKAELTLVGMVLEIIQSTGRSLEEAEMYVNDLMPQYVRHKFECLKVKVVLGNKEDIENPVDSQLYFVKENESDPVWIMYLYISDGNIWYPVGETHYELLQFWAYSDASILQDLMLKPISDEKIISSVDENFNKNK